MKNQTRNKSKENESSLQSNEMASAKTNLYRKGRQTFEGFSKHQFSSKKVDKQQTNRSSSEKDLRNIISSPQKSISNTKHDGQLSQV